MVTTVVSNLDIVAVAGTYASITRGFDVAVTSGSLVIGFTASVDQAKVDAIYLYGPSPQNTTVVRVNAGGGAFTDAAGKVWAADYGFNGGTASPHATGVTGTTDPGLYLFDRHGMTDYTFAGLANGTYHVDLFMAETYWPAAGNRIFSVTATVPAPVPVASFTYSPSSGSSPLTVSFTGAGTNTPTSWAWDFGDGNTSTLRNPSHIFVA